MCRYKWRWSEYVCVWCCYRALPPTVLPRVKCGKSLQLSSSRLGWLHRVYQEGNELLLPYTVHSCTVITARHQRRSSSYLPNIFTIPGAYCSWDLHIFRHIRHCCECTAHTFSHSTSELIGEKDSQRTSTTNLNHFRNKCVVINIVLLCLFVQRCNERGDQVSHGHFSTPETPTSMRSLDNS